MSKTAETSVQSSDAQQQDTEGGESQSKKRRTPGACDRCKRKKIRCDSSETQANRCTPCAKAGLDCTHKEVTKMLGPAKSYVESLEARLEKMDKLMSELLPEIDVNQELECIDLRTDEPETLPRNDDETAMMTVQLGRLKLNPEQNRFFGKSSHYQLVQTALDLKEQYNGEPTPAIKHNKKWKRDRFWDIPKWTGPDILHDHWQDAPTYVYPPDDLMPTLIDAYFTHINPFAPLLHRPTFERSLADALHLTDSRFGATLLLVCAHGAKYSHDPRVLIEGQDWLSAGWKWFEQVKLFRQTLYNQVTLGELQVFALHAQYLQSGPISQGVWVEIGYAMRLALEVGAHRKRKKSDMPTTENELWKRAFWVIFTIDRRLSAVSGRSTAAQDEDFDLDFPLECDDEYWEQGFVQPSEKPSVITFFNCYLRLLDIVGHAMRMIYSIKRPSSSFHKGPPMSDQDLIAELDSLLNAWMDSVPPHLKWHTNHANPLFLHQSAFLHASYYHLQIFIHRPFVPSPRNPRPSSFPSLAICTNAARSCCHVLESYRKGDPLALIFEVTFSAAVVLLLNIWSGKRSGFAPNPRREMEDVKRCMQILQASEDRWYSAGRYLDILVELTFAGNLSLMSDDVPSVESLDAWHGKKRPREDADDGDLHTSSTESMLSADATRRMAGTNRATRSLRRLTPSDDSPGVNVSLPISSDQLGALPIYGQFSFSNNVAPSLPFAPDFVGGQDTSFFIDSIFPDLAGSYDDLRGSGSGNPQNNTCPPVDNASLRGHANSLHLAHDMQVASSSGIVQFQDPFDGSVMPTVLQPESLIYQRGEDFATFLDLSEGRAPSAMPIDDVSIAMWSTAPMNMEFDDWNSYIANLERITQLKEKEPHTLSDVY